MLGVEHRVCSRTLGRAGEVLLGLVESDVGHFCFCGSFAWGVMVSSDSSSVVFPLGLLSSCGAGHLEVCVGTNGRSGTACFQRRF